MTTDALVRQAVVTAVVAAIAALAQDPEARWDRTDEPTDVRAVSLPGRRDAWISLREDGSVFASVDLPALRVEIEVPAGRMAEEIRRAVDHAQPGGTP